MKMGDDTSLLLHVARLYYEKGLTKTEISHDIKTSTTQVARLLKEAREKGIVRIEYHPPRLQKLELDLISRFGCLREAVVVPSSGKEDFWFQLKMIGKAAAIYFETKVRPGMRVGISGGNTLFEMIAALPDHDRDIMMFPTAILGQGSVNAEHVDPMVLLTLLWVKSGRKESGTYYVTILPFENGATPSAVRKEYQEFLRRDKVREVYEGMKSVDIVFASIGPMVGGDPQYRKLTGHTLARLVSEIGMTEKEMRKEGILADISYCFFDRNGNTKPQWDVFLTLGLEHFKKMTADPKKDVVVMAGMYKLEGIRAVLKGKICSVLITDEITANDLLSSGL